MSGDSSSQPQPAPLATAGASRPVPWGPVTAVVVTLLAFVVAQLLGGIVTSFLPVIAGASSDEVNVWINSVAGQFVFVLISEVLTVGFLVLFLRRRRATLADLGLGRSPRWTDAGYAIVGFVVYFALLVAATSLAGTLLHIDTNQQQELGFQNVYGMSDKIMALVSLVILPPLVEETLFRGFLYSGLRKKLRVPVAILLTSLLFGLPHLFESSSGLLWVAGIDTFILSLVLCFLREKSGSLWAGIAVHALKNGIAFTYLFIILGH